MGRPEVRTIGVVTVSRSDYGICLPILRLIEADPGLRLHLMVSGMHLSPEYGFTARRIEEDGFEIGERIEMLLPSDTPKGIGKSMGQGVIGFARAYDRLRPDILLVAGDRFEMHAAVTAALPFNIPVAHIHGGESTEGAIDEAMRHSITKMSHLHFTATEVYAGRVIQMGEEPWRVHVTGAPGLDNLRSTKLLSARELKERHRLDVDGETLVVTYHPVTLEYGQAGAQLEELLTALERSGMNVVFTYPNADTGNRTIISMVEEFARKYRKFRTVVNLGVQGYFSLMSLAAAMVGNSSSGIIEAASFGLPVVNIGSRQRGRIRPENVIDVGCERGEITEGIRKAVSPGFRAGLADLVNPYGDGHAAKRIVRELKTVVIDEKLLQKRFYETGGRIEPAEETEES